MRPQSEFEQDIAQLIVESLNLEDISAADIDPDEALFGEGLGLDSIDALEIGVALQKRYSIKLEGKSDKVRNYFASVRALAQLVMEKREGGDNAPTE